MTLRFGQLLQAGIGHLDHAGVGLDVHWGLDLQGKNS
jgi:hypothetical protein